VVEVASQPRFNMQHQAGTSVFAEKSLCLISDIFNTY
jgi:hypothetical protein